MSGTFPFGCVSVRVKCGLGMWGHQGLTPCSWGAPVDGPLWSSDFFSLFQLDPVTVSSQSPPQGSVPVPSDASGV